MMEVIDMYDHQKLILYNVADNVELFRKELKKSIGWLTADDIRKLYIWLKTNYWGSHGKEILDVFLAEAYQ